jgi:hypothetical protein
MSNGPLEEHLDWLRGRMDDRRMSFKNRARTNLFLALAQLHRNHRADDTTYATRIRDHLVAQDGHLGARPRRADPPGVSSLRSTITSSPAAPVGPQVVLIRQAQQDIVAALAKAVAQRTAALAQARLHTAGAEVPACPQHPTGSVRAHGTYTSRGQRHQRYLCMPADNGKLHTFSV